MPCSGAHPGGPALQRGPPQAQHRGKQLKRAKLRRGVLQPAAAKHTRSAFMAMALFPLYPRVERCSSAPPGQPLAGQQ